MERVLIVEDERPLARFLELELQREGFATDLAAEGRPALEMALQHDYRFILLDLMLPGLTGYEICRRIRQVKHTPIIMLTARDSVLERVGGLDCGADDYMVKPFAIEELLARMRSLGRRSGRGQQAQLYEIADLVLNPETHEVSRAGIPFRLSGREYELLKYMMENKDIVLSRSQILSHVWGYQFEGETNVVDVYIRYLRSKMDDPYEYKLIHTVRNYGYVLKDPRGADK